ncbi:hypothetical protein ACSBR1_025918 [Camellia fascicularis]
MRLRNAMGFKILEMDRVSFHWIVKCRVNLRPLISVFPEIDTGGRSRRCKFQVLCVVKGVSENDFELVFVTAGKAIYYDLKCKTSRVLLDHLRLLNFLASIFFAVILVLILINSLKVYPLFEISNRLQ